MFRSYMVDDLLSQRSQNPPASATSEEQQQHQQEQQQQQRPLSERKRRIEEEGEEENLVRKRRRTRGYSIRFAGSPSRIFPRCCLSHCITSTRCFCVLCFAANQHGAKEEVHEVFIDGIPTSIMAGGMLFNEDKLWSLFRRMVNLDDRHRFYDAMEFGELQNWEKKKTNKQTSNTPNARRIHAE